MRRDGTQIALSGFEGRGPPNTAKSHIAGALVGADPQHDFLIRIKSGWASEARILTDGRKQIFSILLPADDVLMPAGQGPGAMSLTALTTLNVIKYMPTTPGAWDTPPLAPLVRQALIRQNGRLRDHIVRLGSLNAYQRTAHLLLDLHTRLSVVGLVRQNSFRIPFTQDTFASLLGLSVVHVNRTLQALRRHKLIVLKAGSVTLVDPDALATVASYALHNSAAVAQINR